MEIKDESKHHLASLIDSKLDPLMEQISTLSSTIKEVATTANAALEGSEKNGGIIKELRAAECQIKERLAWLEQRA